MSFSKKVKEELAETGHAARHCNIAELAAMIECCGQQNQTADKLLLQTENIVVARRAALLLKSIFKFQVETVVHRNKKNSVFRFVFRGSKTVGLVIKTLKLKVISEPEQPLLSVDNLVVQNTCCKRAFIRGAFLCAGSVADPAKTYHLEIVYGSERLAKHLKEIMNSFCMDSKIVLRKRYYVVYLKEGSQIVDLLNIMGAHVALMELENVRILKEVRNSVNRKVNCETANINKTVTAAARQIREINYIKNTVGLEHLTEGLEEIAQLRLAYPDATLKELGEMLCPKVGKSGVNHRLKKLCSIAEELREKERMKNDK